MTHLACMALPWHHLHTFIHIFSKAVNHSGSTWREDVSPLQEQTSCLKIWNTLISKVDCFLHSFSTLQLTPGSPRAHTNSTQLNSSCKPLIFTNLLRSAFNRELASSRLVFGIGILQTRENINQKNSLFACDYFFAYSSSRIRKIISSSLCTGQKEKKNKQTGNCTGFSSFLSFLSGLEKEDAHLNVCTKGHC